MSVAFRRESDEEHKEPRFELPIPPGPNLVTPRGLVLLEAKVAEVEAAVAATSEAERLTELQRDLRYWHTRLTTAQIAPRPADGTVGIGSRVSVTINGKPRRIEIVGGDEAVPEQDRIAFFSPLARVLIGAEDGDTIDFNGIAGAIEVLGVAAIDA